MSLNDHGEAKGRMIYPQNKYSRGTQSNMVVRRLEREFSGEKMVVALENRRLSGRDRQFSCF